MNKIIGIFISIFVEAISMFILGVLTEIELENMRHCSKAPILKNAKFYCRDCHNELSIHDKFCNQCGRKIDWE